MLFQKTMEETMSNIRKIKYNFDRITSENSQNWQLVLFWIVVFELAASIFEYIFFENTRAFVYSMPYGLEMEVVIAITFTAFIWLCVYNFIFWNKTNLLFLVLFAITGIYLIITKDVTFNFLLHNLEPIHFFQGTFNFALFIELFIKLIILYLIYQLVKSYKKRNNRLNQ